MYALAFLLGCLSISWLPNVDSGGLFFCYSIIFCLIVRYLYPSLTTLSVAYLLGLLLVLVTANSQKQQQITSPEHRIIDAYITDLPIVKADKVTFKIQSLKTQQTFLISHYNGLNYTTEVKPLPSYEPGDFYRFELALKPPHGTVNGVGFDREKWLFRHGIDGLGSVRSAQEIEPTKISIIQFLKAHLNQWRLKLSRQIDDAFVDKRVNALLHALSIGDKTRFETHDYQLFQTTGTAHLIAISGLHIGLVAAMGALVGWLVFIIFPQQYLPRPLLQVIFGLALAISYAGLAGFTISTQRALIMLTVYAWFKWNRRQAYAWDVWSISLLCVLIIDPLNVLDAGFWLSFWAVAILILAFQGRASESNKLINFIRIQWLLFVGMMPLSLIQFGHIKLWGPLVNLMVIPLMTLLLIPALLISLIIGSLIGYIPAFLATYLNHVSTLFWLVLDLFSSVNPMAWGWPINQSWSFILVTIAALYLLLPKAVPQRFWGIVLIFIVLWPTTTSLSKGHFEAHFLDVGQGTSVFIKTQHHYLLYDVGSRYPSGFNMADAVIIPFLDNQRISQLDRVILSHKDNDHAGAYIPLENNILIKQTLSTDGQFEPCIVGQKWTWDGVLFEVLSPYNIKPYLKNNSSCVLKIKGHHLSLLLTGDIEQAVEYRLRQQHLRHIKADILLIPHHGSNTSSTPEFIATVKPQIAVNSSGAYNQFNHPTQRVQLIYEQQSIPIIDTQSSGQITIKPSTSNTSNMTLERYRQKYPKFWRGL